MNTRRILAALALGIFFSGAVVDDAMARAGRSSRTGTYRSTGWRGSRTPDSGSMQGINQTRRQPNQPMTGQSQQRPSWFQRNPFLSGLMGAVAGSALFAMLGSAFGGFGGFGSGLLTILLVAGLAMLALRMFRPRRQAAFGNGMTTPHQAGPARFDIGGGQSSASGLADFGAYRQTREQGLAAIALETPTFTTAKVEDEISHAFFRVQDAWSAEDRQALRALTTPEMYAEFAGELDEMGQRGERNVIKNLVVRSFAITEAWQDEAEEYITARIDARLIDYVERNGQVVDGSATEPTEFREAWTFARPRRDGGQWLLSAINQF